MTHPQTLNLIEQLKQISDYRKGKGKRHALWLVMMLVLLGTFCGYRGYRLLADFTHQHWQSLCELLELPKSATWLSQAEQSHVHRQVSVYAAPVGLHRHWQGLKHLIWVKRWGMRDGQSFEENIGYITNLEGSAAQFLAYSAALDD